MLVLFETPAGYALFKVSNFYHTIKPNLKIVHAVFLSCPQLLDESKLKEVDNLYKDFETPKAAGKM